MKLDFTQLVRPHLVELTPYSSARDEYKGTEGVFLDANENPFGSVTGDLYNRYPDPHQTEIKRKLSQIKGVREEQIFLGNGSDEAIDLLIKALCEPKQDSILILPPTYGMYKVCADIQQVTVISSPLTKDFDLDVEGIEKTIQSHTKMIWICSPNNPSGNLVDQEKIRTIVSNYSDKIVVIDEAYIDFAPEASWLPYLDEYPNLVVLQTFSKAWGMAGLRLGMAFAHPNLIQVLNKIKYPYNLNILTQQALLKALDHEDIKNKMVSDLIEARNKLAESLLHQKEVLHVFPSDSNQLLVRVRNPKGLFQYLIDQKVITRDRSNVLLCEGCLRISVGTPAENQHLMKEMNRFSQSHS